MIQASDAEILLRWASLIGSVLIVAGVATFAIRTKSRQHARRLAIWRRFALDNRLNLTVEADSWLKPGNFKITGRVGEIDLELSTYRVKVGKSSQTWVRVASRGKGPAGSFTVQRSNPFLRAGAWFGADPTPVDEGEFDRKFLTRSEPKSLARDVLDAPLRDRYARLSRSPRLSCDDGACELNWLCGDESFEQLAAAVEMHAMLRGSFARLARVQP